MDKITIKIENRAFPDKPATIGLKVYSFKTDKTYLPQIASAKNFISNPITPLKLLQMKYKVAIAVNKVTNSHIVLSLLIG